MKSKNPKKSLHDIAEEVRNWPAYLRVTSSVRNQQIAERRKLEQIESEQQAVVDK